MTAYLLPLATYAFPLCLFGLAAWRTWARVRLLSRDIRRFKILNP